MHHATVMHFKRSAGLMLVQIYAESIVVSIKQEMETRWGPGFTTRGGVKGVKGAPGGGCDVRCI